MRKYSYHISKDTSTRKVKLRCESCKKWFEYYRRQSGGPKKRFCDKCLRRRQRNGKSKRLERIKR